MRRTVLNQFYWNSDVGEIVADLMMLIEDVKEMLRDRLKIACLDSNIRLVHYILSDEVKLDKLLLSHTGKDEGKTLLHHAVIGGNADIVALLLYCALREYDNNYVTLSKAINTLDDNSNTAMMYAAYYRNIRAISIITYFDPSSMNFKDTYGYTPIYIAFQLQYTNVYKFMHSIDTNGYFYCKDGTMVVQSDVAEEVKCRFNNRYVKGKDKEILSNCCSLKACFRYWHIIESNASIVSFRILLTSLLIAVVMSVYMYTRDADNFYTDIKHYLSFLLQLVTFVVFNLIINSNPGTLDVECNTYMDVLESISKKENNCNVITSSSFCCHICRHRKPQRAAHSVEGRCIPLLDHYCPFLCKEIGKDNYLLFLQFLISLNCSMILFMYNALQYMHLHSNKSMIGKSILAFFVWTLLVWVFVLIFLLYHVRLIYLGITTREDGQMKKLPYVATILKLPLLLRIKCRFGYAVAALEEGVVIDNKKEL